MTGYDSDNVDQDDDSDIANNSDIADNSDTSNDSDINDANILEILGESDHSTIAMCEWEAPSDELHNHQDMPSNQSKSDVLLPPSDIQSEAANTSSSALVVINPFSHGSPGVPISQGSHIDHMDCKASNNLIWAPFGSQCEWEIAYWSKMHGSTSSATVDLLVIPKVCLFFLGFSPSLMCDGRLFRTSNCLTAQLRN